MLSLWHREASCGSLHFPALPGTRSRSTTGKLPGLAFSSLPFLTHALAPPQGSFLVRPPLPCLSRHTPSIHHREASWFGLHFPAPLSHTPCPGTGKLPGLAFSSLPFLTHALAPPQGSFLVRPPLPCLSRHTPSIHHREASWFGLHFPAPLSHTPCPGTGKLPGLAFSSLPFLTHALAPPQGNFL